MEARPVGVSVGSQESTRAAKKPSGWTVDDIAVQLRGSVPPATPRPSPELLSCGS